MPQAPGFDTIGGLACDAETFVRAGEALLAAPSDAPAPARLVVLEDAFAVADEPVRRGLEEAAGHIATRFASHARRTLSGHALDAWREHQVILQAHEGWHTFRDWLDRANPRLIYEVAGAFLRGARVDDTTAEHARAFLAARRADVLQWLDAGTVLCLPTAPCVAPRRGPPRSVMWLLRSRVLTLTCIAGTLGAPQLSVPLASADGLPVGLSFIAAPERDEALLALARALA
jgi:amidase